MTKFTVLVLSLLATSLAFGVGQTDWSGGSGVGGPVTEFGTTFDTQSNVNYLGAGVLQLAQSTKEITKYTVDSNLNGACEVSSGDLNGDGYLDIAATGTYEDEIRCYLNDGTGTVWTEYIVDSDCDGATGVDIKDIDGDGDMDILGTSAYDDYIAWYENSDGTGTSWIEHLIDDDFNGARQIVGADMDNDGDIDAVCVASNADDVAWWENSGNGTTWTRHDIENTFDGAYGCDVNDIDGDGDLDVIACASYADDITWFENTDGLGTSWVENTIDATYDGAKGCYAADFDGDGDLDILGTANTADDVNWFENTDGVGGSWTDHVLNNNFNSARGCYAGDFDNDGDIDAVACGSSEDEILWWENDGTGSFTENSLDSSIDSPSYCCVGDFDGDGYVDISATAYYDDEVVWYKLFGLAYATSGSLESSILDISTYHSAGFTWGDVSWNSDITTGTLVIQVRASDDYNSMGTWSSDISVSGTDLSTYLGTDVDYFQYKVFLSTSDPSSTPTLYDIDFEMNLGVLSCYAVQGQQGSTPFAGTEVSVTGIVTASAGVYHSKKAMIGDASGGAWSGLLLYGDSVMALVEGDSIVVTGTASEYNDMTQIGTITNVDVIASGVTLPPVTAVSTVTIGQDSTTAEQYESVLISISDAVITNILSYGEYNADDGSGICMLDDLGDATYTPVLGDTILTGIGTLHFTYGDYKLEPRYDADLTIGAFVAGIDTLTCYQVQGQASTSPYEGQQICAHGVVVVGGDEYYSSSSAYAVIMDAGSGAWSGLMMYDSTLASLQRGDSVSVVGTVIEYNNMTELTYLDTVIVHSSGHTLPAAESLSSGDVGQEQWESVLISLTDAVVTEENLGYGEWAVDDGSGEIRIDDLGSDTYDPVLGDVLTELIGVNFYTYSNWKLEPRDNDDLEMLGEIVTVTTPDNASVWEHYSTGYDVEWQYPFEIGTSRFTYGDSVSIALYDDTVLVETLVTATYNDSSWAMTNAVSATWTPGTVYRIYIEDSIGNFGWSDYFSVSAVEIIDITAPDSTTEWARGSTNHDITWETTGLTSTTVDIYVYKANSAYAQIATGTDNDGSWTYAGPVPGDWAAGSDYRIKIVDNYSDWGWSDDFSVTGEANITVTHPTTGTVWNNYQTTTLCMWTNPTDNGPLFEDSVFIEIWKDGVYLFDYTDDWVPNKTRFKHKTPLPGPDTLSASSNYQLKVIDDNGNYGFSNYFTINNGAEIINVFKPDTTDIWTTGEEKVLVAWTFTTTLDSPLAGDSISMEIYKDGVYVDDVTGGYIGNWGFYKRSAAVPASWGTGTGYQVKVVDELGNWGWSQEFYISGGDEVINVTKPDAATTWYHYAGRTFVLWNYGTDTDNENRGNEIPIFGFEPLGGDSVLITLYKSGVYVDEYSTGWVPNTNFYKRTDFVSPSWGTGNDFRIRVEDNLGNYGWSAEFTISSKGDGDGGGGGVGVYELLPITPNPAAGTFSVNFSVPEMTFVNISIFDLTGRLITTPVDSEMSAGTYTEQVTDLPVGTYFCRMQAGEFVDTRQVVVIR